MSGYALLVRLFFMDFFVTADRPTFIEGCLPTAKGWMRFRGYDMDDGTIHFEWERAPKDSKPYVNVAGRDEHEMKYFYDAMQESTIPRDTPHMTAKEATETLHRRKEIQARQLDSKTLFGPTGLPIG